jgi:hypothetical protein
MAAVAAATDDGQLAAQAAGEEPGGPFLQRAKPRQTGVDGVGDC